MGDRETLERIFDIMHRLLLVRMDGLNPIPRKGTTRHECYQALYAIQNLLETNRAFGMHLTPTNADRIRSMSDEELARYFSDIGCHKQADREICLAHDKNCEWCWLDFLKQEVERDG